MQTDNRNAAKRDMYGYPSESGGALIIDCEGIPVLAS